MWSQQFQPPIRVDTRCELAGYETTGKVLGKGATAFVYKGRCLTTGEEVAIKEIDYSRLGNISTKQRQLLESEILIMKKLSEFSHENILTLRYDFSTQTATGYRFQYLILDYCNAEDFHQYLRRNRNVLPEQEAKYFMIQFGMFCFHFLKVSRTNKLF